MIISYWKKLSINIWLALNTIAVTWFISCRYYIFFRFNFKSFTQSQLFKHSPKNEFTFRDISEVQSYDLSFQDNTKQLSQNYYSHFRYHYVRERLSFIINFKNKTLAKLQLWTPHAIIMKDLKNIFASRVSEKKNIISSEEF